MDDVEQFLSGCEVDAAAAQELRTSPREVQRQVLSRGSLSNARNQSSVLRARLRDARDAAAAPAPATRREKFLEIVQDPNWVKVSGMPGSTDVDDVVSFFDAMDFPPDKVIMDLDGSGASAFVRFATEGEVTDALRRLKSQRPLGSAVRRGPAATTAAPRGTPYWSPEPEAKELDAVEQFLLDNPVDDNAAHQLRTAAPELQQTVLSRGNLRGVRNPSAALLARLRGQGPPPVDARPEPPRNEEVEEFLRRYGVDEMASDTMRRARRDVQEAIMDKGLDGVRNPSSALQARLRELSQRSRSRSPRRAGQPLQDDVEDYLLRYNVDQQGCDALRRCSPQVQEMVLERGLEGAYNPSSALSARIKEMNQKVRDMPRGAGGAGGAGGASRRSPRRRSAPIGQAPERKGKATLKQEVEEYLQRYNVDGSACDAMRKCPPEVQEQLMERGLEGAQNPSSALLGKIRDISRRRDSGRRR